MPEFYQTHLKGQLSLAQFLLLGLLIQLLQSLRSVKLESLANKLPLPILSESRRRKLQRFLSLPQLKLELLWFPIWPCGSLKAISHRNESILPSIGRSGRPSISSH